MGNPLKGEVPITLQGKAYILRFTHDAIAKLEGEFNLQAQGGTAYLIMLISLPTLTNYRRLLMHGLQHKWPNIKQAAVDPDEDEAIAEYFKRAGKQLKRAFNLAFTGKDDADDDEPEGDDTKDEAEVAGEATDAARPTE